MDYYLSLGANLGDRITSLNKALSALGRFGTIRKKSAFYRTEPYGMAGQPPFINLVCSFDCGLRPQRLLRKIKQIELESGRTRTTRWGPRVIDIDILDWNGEAVRSEVLTLPHAELEKRAFVLIPLSEIAPSFLTRQGVDISSLIENCSLTTTVKRLEQDDER